MRTSEIVFVLVYLALCNTDTGKVLVIVDVLRLVINLGINESMATNLNCLNSKAVYLVLTLVSEY